MNRGKTLEQCKAIKLQLDLGLSVFVAGQKIKPQKYINTLVSLGCLVEVEPEYITPNLQPLYTDEGIYGFHQPEKKLTGYKIKLK